MQNTTHSLWAKTSIKPLLLALLLSNATTTAIASEDLYYEIGGAVPFSASAGRGYDPRATGIGVRWDIDASCGNFDISATVKNQLNGATKGFKDMMGNVIQNATSAVASLPAMIIQRANPALYDLLSNGVLQARVDFDKSKLSCQAMTEKMADAAMGNKWKEKAEGEKWEKEASFNSDAVAVEESVEKTSGNEGVTWTGGAKRGGLGQPPIKVINDVAKAGFNILHKEENVNGNTEIKGGGKGWGSVSSVSGPWTGNTDQAGETGITGTTGTVIPGTSTLSKCYGGMCTLWKNSDQAASWVSKVVGEQQIQTCDGCNKVVSTAGTGLYRDLEVEQKAVYTALSGLVNSTRAITIDDLATVSAGDSVALSKGVIRALRKDSQSPLLVMRLSSEVAYARTMMKALWANQVLMAGSSDSGVIDNEQGLTVLDARVDRLNREIDLLRKDMDIRNSLSSSASLVIERSLRRAANSSITNKFKPNAKLDSKGEPTL